MQIVYLGVSQHTLDRAPSLQMLHTLRALVAAGANLTYITPWPEHRVRRGCREMLGQDFPAEIRLKSIGAGPDWRLLGRLWPTQVWSGIAARVRRYVQGLAGQAADTVVYTRDLRIAAGYPAGCAPPLILEYHEPQSVTIASDAKSDHRVPWLEQEERRAMARVSGLVTVSRGHHDEVPQLYDYHGPRWVIPNGVNLETFAIPDSERRPVPGRLLYAGALKPWKGLELVLEVLALDSAWELHVAGGRPGDSNGQRLRELADRLGVASRLQWHGLIPQHHLRPLMASAMAGLLPLNGRFALAERYTCPLKLMEYLAAGLPVVATDLLSVRQFVRPDHDALLFADGDAASLRSALRRLSDEPGLAARLSRQGREVPPQYTWEKRAFRILAACEDVLSRQQSQTSRAEVGKKCVG